MKIHVSIDIDANTAEVWQELRDLASHVTWMADAESLVFTSDQREGVGTSFIVATKVGPLRTSDQMTITQWIDGKSIGVVHAGAVSGSGQFTLTSRGNRTTFAWDEDLTLPWWLGARASTPVAALVLRRIWKKNLQSFKARLEKSDTFVAPETEADATIGTLLGTGRHGDVHEFGRTRVIVHDRRGASSQPQRELMQWLYDHGYPLPKIYDHDDDTAIVMDRIDGPSMLDDLTSRPWMLRSHAKILAQLHTQLDNIPVPPNRAGAAVDTDARPDRIVHLDMHPGNVLMSPVGPVVVDWANADIGPRGLDRAMSWVLIKTGSVDGHVMTRAVVQTFRERFADTYRKMTGNDTVASYALTAAELRMLDTNLRRDESDAVFRLARSLQGQPTHSRTDDV